MTGRSISIALIALAIGAAGGWFASSLARADRPDAEWVAVNWSVLLERTSDAAGEPHEAAAVAEVTALSLMAQTTALVQHYDTIRNPSARQEIHQRLDRAEALFTRLDPPRHSPQTLGQARDALACLRDAASTGRRAGECFAERHPRSTKG